MSDPPEPVTRRKLSHEVATRLMAAIAAGEYHPGAHLPSERELMVRYGVGRPAIREAMQALQQQGLIRIAHGERATVVVPTAAAVVDSVSAAMVHLLAACPAGLVHLKEARRMFEVGLARLAATRATEAGRAALGQAHEACQALRGQGAVFVAADMAFHRQIAALSGNPLFSAVSGGMLDWLSTFRRELVSVRGADRLTLQEHGRIAAAIAGCDPDGAAAAMAAHLDRVDATYSVLAEEAEHGSQRPRRRRTVPD